MEVVMSFSDILGWIGFKIGMCVFIMVGAAFAFFGVTLMRGDSLIFGFIISMCGVGAIFIAAAMLFGDDG
jgi:hypothetical protein